MFEGRRFSLLAFGVLAATRAATTVPVADLGGVCAALVGLVRLALMGAESLQAWCADAALHGLRADRAGARQIALAAWQQRFEGSAVSTFKIV